MGPMHGPIPLPTCIPQATAAAITRGASAAAVGAIYTVLGNQVTSGPFAAEYATALAATGMSEALCTAVITAQVGEGAPRCLKATILSCRLARLTKVVASCVCRKPLWRRAMLHPLLWQLGMDLLLANEGRQAALWWHMDAG